MSPKSSSFDEMQFEHKLTSSDENTKSTELKLASSCRSECKIGKHNVTIYMHGYLKLDLVDISLAMPKSAQTYQTLDSFTITADDSKSQEYQTFKINNEQPETSSSKYFKPKLSGWRSEPKDDQCKHFVGAQVLHLFCKISCKNVAKLMH